MKQGLVRLLYNFGKRFMGWTLHMIMCVLLCYPVSIYMSQLLSTGRPISSSEKQDGCREHFFENYLPFSTGWFSYVES